MFFKPFQTLYFPLVEPYNASLHHCNYLNTIYRTDSSHVYLSSELQSLDCCFEDTEKPTSHKVAVLLPNEKPVQFFITLMYSYVCTHML